jgi:periplasmic protein TonB
MRRDLIIGILVSVLVHGGFAALGELSKGRKKAPVKEEEPPTIQVAMPPPIEPDEPETVDLEPTPQQETAALAPPSIVDIPGVVLPDSFTQQIQPPPPPNLGKPTGLTAIPPGRPGTGAIGKGLGEIFDIRNLDQQPAERGVRAQPSYPFEMRRAGINGEVIVGFIVDTNGDVRDAYVIKSSQREFEAPALQAVMKWKWKPGRKGGKAVNTRMQIPIVFNLTDAD